MIDHPVLHASERFGVRLGLDRMRRFLRTLGGPQERVPMVHVAGTNGKGSVSTMVAEVLRHQGYRTGLYTSPHLRQVNERIQVDGVPIPDAALSALLHRLAQARQDMGGALQEIGEPDEPLTYFELLTAAAFVHFADVAVEIAVVEVGMGGRLDATSVGNPVVSAITSIGLDHTEFLGSDHASIAAEKAGILRPGVPAVVGGVPADALRVIRTVAQTRGAPLQVYGEDFHVTRDGDSFSWHGPGGTRRGLRVGMEGTHQVDNAAVALAMVDLLPVALACDEPAVRAGLAEARIRGRLEWVAPDVLVDATHNMDGAVTLAAYLRSRPRQGPRTLVLGCSMDKDVRAMGVLLAPWVDRIYTTACDHPRSMPPGAVAAALEAVSVPVMPAGPLQSALPLARAGGGEVVVAGSIFLAGAVMDLLGTP